MHEKFNQLYQYLVEGDIDNFCDNYSIDFVSLHDALISTAYINKGIVPGDTRYQKFIDFLLRKKATPQITALMILQTNPQALEYFNLLDDENKKKLIANNTTFEIAINHPEVAIKMTQELSADIYLKKLYCCHCDKIKNKILSSIPESENNIKSIISLYKKDNRDIYLDYLEQFYDNARDVLKSKKINIMVTDSYIDVSNTVNRYRAGGNFMSYEMFHGYQYNDGDNDNTIYLYLSLHKTLSPKSPSILKKI